MAVKRKISVPFFEIGPKSYLYGDEVLELAKAADAAAEKYGMAGNLVAGANIAGFLKVADAMLAQGAV